MTGFIAGIFETVVGASGVLAPLRRFLPPYVCGLVVLTIGVSLARVAGGWVFADPNPTMLGLAGAAVLSIVVLTVIGYRLRMGVLARGAIFFSLMIFGAGVAGLPSASPISPPWSGRPGSGCPVCSRSAARASDGSSRAAR